MDKKLRDLDDVNKALKEKTVEEVAEPTRTGRRNTAMHKGFVLDWEELKGLVTIPIVIIILMIVIVILDKDPVETDVKETDSVVTETIAVESSEDVETESMAETEDPTIVRAYYDEYLTSFFEGYFNARLEADTDKLYEITGVTNQTDEQKALLKSQLETQAGYIESFQDIRQYAVSALEENSKLVFVTYNIKFRRVSTLAPGIMYCYIKVNDSNQFEIVENLTPEQTKFVNEYITNHEEVQELINTSNSQLLQAITNDERLSVIYDAFQSGRIYTDSKEKIDSQVSLITVDGDDVTSGAEESASNGDTAEITDSTSAETDASMASTDTETNASSVEPVAQSEVQISSEATSNGQ
ncbi:hypothetical protein [Oribacterium sp. WCC10]|uniref:hypothetical protein n=1 Tax=Oribacterium sp. WCC10 TaxID=1855343 RepID=UPI0008DF06FB|nr:hypothetical protein [Oribacterium sp. WCC10]SFG26722.1 hypothetical protein SAMN05216356_104162 [Oribacterium sp. WCC10]